MIVEIVTGTLIVAALVLLLTVFLLAARRVLVPQGAVAVRVNEQRSIDAARGETLLNVLHRAGIAIPAGCGGSGTCGLCRVTVEGEGGGEVKATEKGLLSPRERKDRVRLACQVSLRGPIDVEVPEGVFAAETFACPVVSTRMLAPLIREIVLEVPEGHEIPYRPGDFMQLQAPAFDLAFRSVDVAEPFLDVWQVNRWDRLSARSDKPVTRAYSVANRPEDAGKLVFNIRLAVPPAGREDDIPPGVVSSWLFGRRPGDEVPISGPFGDFHVQPTTREMVFVGGGVGMAPLRAMIHAELAAGTERRISYYYGARTLADLFYREEFDRLAAAHPNFTWTPALSDPAPGDRWRGETGFIHETLRARLSRHPAPEDCEYYLCGPPVMISAVIGTLTRLGVDRSAIHNDDFGS